MKIFVIGFSQSGKSTFSKTLAGTYNAEHITASNWTKRFKIDKSDPEYREKVTAASREALSKDHLVAVHAIRAAILDSSKAIKIIEGIRNPLDFMHLFDLKNDYVVLLLPKNVVSANLFDDGVKAIQTNLSWMVKNDIIPMDHVFVEQTHELEETQNLAKCFHYGNRQLFRKCN